MKSHKETETCAFYIDCGSICQPDYKVASPSLRPTKYRNRSLKPATYSSDGCGLLNLSLLPAEIEQPELLNTYKVR